MYQNINKLHAGMSQKSRVFRSLPQSIVLVVIFTLSGSLNSCSLDSDQVGDFPIRDQSANVSLSQKNTFYVSTWLIKYLTKSLLKGLDTEYPDLTIRMISPPDQDPARYVPDAQTLTELQTARLIILNGAHFERGLEAVSLPLSRVVKSASSIRDRWLKYPKSFSRGLHQHGPEGAHNHQGVDGHTWLDPRLLKSQLAQIKTRIRNAGFKVSTAAHRHLTEQIDQLDQLWVKLSPALRQRELVSNHPAYQYVSRRYQLKITPFDLSPDEAPHPSQVKELHRHLLQQRSQQVSQGRHTPPIMLWESTPSTSTLDTLKSLKLIHVVLNTLEQPPIKTKNSDSDAPNPLQRYAEQLHHLTSVLEISVESNTTSH